MLKNLMAAWRESAPSAGTLLPLVSIDPIAIALVAAQAASQRGVEFHFGWILAANSGLNILIEDFSEPNSRSERLTLGTKIQASGRRQNDMMIGHAVNHALGDPGLR